MWVCRNGYGRIGIGEGTPPGRLERLETPPVSRSQNETFIFSGGFRISKLERKLMDFVALRTFGTLSIA